MKKKRRENKKIEEIYLNKLKTNLKGYVAEEVSRIQDEGFICKEYSVLPKFGNGTVVNYYFNEITISICRFLFTKDFIIHNKSKKNKMQLSFLLEGEKIICTNNNCNEIPYTNQESYMAYVDNYNGYNKIFGGKPFKEIKITFSENFLLNHGISHDVHFKKLTDNDLMIAMNHELFPILSDIETIEKQGVSRKIFLEAKVLEILAIQIENYKNLNKQNISLKNPKNIKKLFLLKEFLKNNLDKNFSIHQLSMQFGLNENELKFEFKRVFGFTINQFFISEKMNKAKELLQSTELPIYQIAEDVGYKNATHFSAAFKRFYNKTPKSCRSSL